MRGLDPQVFKIVAVAAVVVCGGLFVQETSYCHPEVERKKLSLKKLMTLASATEAIDYSEIKRHLPIAYILEKHGFTVQAAGVRLTSLCPFHNDTGEPNFNVFSGSGTGLELDKYQCWSCNAMGDVIDLLKHFEPDLVPDGSRTSGALFQRVRELITEIVDAGWTGPAGVGTRKAFNVHEAREIVEQSQVDPSLTRIQEFIDSKREQRGEHAWPYDAQYAVDEWRWGTYGTWVIIPYYTRDGELLAYKRWTSPEKPRFAPEGSQWVGHLYGEWREDDGRPVILCEGESDCLKVHYEVGESYRVLGLPTGAGSSPDAVASQFENRTVYIAFDGDAAGYRGAQRWAEELSKYTDSVRVVPIPSGKDISSTLDAVGALIQQARPMLKAPTGVAESKNGYVTYDRKGNAEDISNFVFRPERELYGDGTFAYEGKLLPGGDPAILRASDLESDLRARKWANSYRRGWFGNTKSASLLLGKLQAEGVFLPSGKLVTVAGLHNDTFVWPGGRIGPEPLVYLPPQNDAGLDSKLLIQKGPWDTSIVHLMRSIQRREVTDPLLAWMAASVLRSRFAYFPFVFVRGHHEDGKALAVTEPVLTPKGWVEIGKLAVGDTVASADGSFVPVTGVYPQSGTEVYKVSFSDQTSVLASPDHLWTAYDMRSKLWKIVTTLDMATRQWRLPLIAPIQFPDAELPVEPYTLGAVLGDGCISQKYPTITSDVSLMEAIGCTAIWRSKTRMPCGNLSHLREPLMRLGLMGAHSETKFVPEVYLRGSISQRKALLAGLLDTDGTPTAHGAVEFGSASANLAYAVLDLVRSLGGTGKLSARQPWFTYKGERRQGKTQYRLSLQIPFNPFRLERKAIKWKPYTTYGPSKVVRSVVRVDDQPTVCIKVDHPTHLFVTSGYTLTHNTMTTQTLMHAFAGSYIEATFTSSIHGIKTVVASNNFSPVDLEEYRDGSKAATMVEGEQLLRQAYTEQAELKGGMGENWAKAQGIIPSAPIIVTGEGSLTEGSHADRMIPIHMNKLYQNPAAFDQLREISTNGFPFAFVSWIQSKLGEPGFSDPIEVTPSFNGELGTRQRNNIGVLHFGWNLLQEFMADHNDNLDEPNFSEVVNDMLESKKHTPLEEAIGFCVTQIDCREFCFAKEDETIWVQPERLYEFLQDHRRKDMYKLPGKVPAMISYLEERMGAAPEKHNMQRFYVIPAGGM